ncbi:TetR/AcrR family transcriptional regulator [Escherichia coli]|nr:TetR/AcrR family transcriptional regulator [Escherichia coli]
MGHDRRKSWPGRPRKTESTYADTRNDLIRSGLELLTQNGFLATGVDAIVKNANVPKGSFYYYFKSKEDYAQTVLNAYDSFFEHKLKNIYMNHPAHQWYVWKISSMMPVRGLKIQFYPRLPGWKYDAGESGASPILH